MFWTEEDIQPVVDATVTTFGTVGNMTTERGAILNVVIFSKQYGKLWYGDIADTMENIVNNCNVIGQKFNILVEPLTNAY